MSAEQKFSNGPVDRRRFLQLAGASLFLTACGEDFLIFQREQAKQSEKPNRIPQMGDVIMDGDKAYRIVLDKKYPIPDLKKYLEYTEQENAEILSGTPEVKSALDRYETGIVPQQKIIIIQGDEKINKPEGGKLICIGGGFMTEDGIPSDGLISPANLFVPFKRRLEQNGFTFLDNFFFPWGKKDLKSYSSSDTAKNPEDSINDMIDYIEYLAREFPLTQQNWVVHSLAGVILIGALIKRPDLLGVIGNIAFLSSPIRGIDAIHKISLDIAKLQSEIVRLYLGNEKVSSYLAKIWMDKDKYQKQVDEIGKRLIDSGKGVLVAWAKNDLALSEDSVKIEGAKTIVILSESFDISKPLTYLDPHGATLRSDLVINETLEKIGQNRTALR